MSNYEKFEGIDYVNNFARKINSMHELVGINIKTIIEDDFKIIDLGGGPGIGAKIIDKIGKKVTLLNVEPSANILEIPELKHVNYQTLKLSFKDALSYNFPWKANLILMVSAAHEITLANGKSDKENKTIFFNELLHFIKTNAREDGLIAIGFPNYKDNVSEQEMTKQMEYTKSLLGHSHPQSELFTVKEFSNIFGAEPFLYERVPMILNKETEDETKLMANFAIFKIDEIKVS